MEDGSYCGPLRVWLKEEDIPGLAMTRSIGDLVASSVGVSWEPELNKFDLDQKDKFLVVASDGVWEFLDCDQVVSIVSPFYERWDIEGACDELMKLSLRQWRRVSHW
jgi:serine/threonine protein phosphatase PrpC